MKKGLLYSLLFILLSSLSSCKKQPPDLDYGPFNYGHVKFIQTNGSVVVKLESGNGNVISHTRGMQISGGYGSSGLLINGGGEITIGVDDITIMMNGGGGVTNSATPGYLIAHNISIAGQGANVDLKNLVVDSTIAVSILNTGQYVMQGSCKYLQVSSTNMGKFFGFDLTTDSCYFDNSSINQIQVNVTKKLTGVINSMGATFYKGSPPVVNVSHIGTGQLVPY